MEIFLLCLFLVFYAAMSVMDYLAIKKLKDTAMEEKVKVKFYRQTVVWGWIPALFVLLVVAITPITLVDIGLRPIAFHFIGEYKFAGPIILLLCASFFVLLCYQMVSYCLSAKYREAVKNKVFTNKKFNTYYERVMFNVMIPKTRKEKKWFALVSLTAGIGEEILFRGFLFFLITSSFPGIPMDVIPLITGLFFGLVHLYQGINGVIKTFLVGALIGFLYLASNSLILCMMLHFVMDISSNFLYSPDETQQNNA